MNLTKEEIKISEYFYNIPDAGIKIKKANMKLNNYFNDPITLKKFKNIKEIAFKESYKFKAERLNVPIAVLIEKDLLLKEIKEKKKPKEKISYSINQPLPRKYKRKERYFKTINMWENMTVNDLSKETGNNVRTIYVWSSKNKLDAIKKRVIDIYKMTSFLKNKFTINILEK